MFGRSRVVPVSARICEAALGCRTHRVVMAPVMNAGRGAGTMNPRFTAMTSNSKDRSAQPADMPPPAAAAGPSRHERVLDEAARQLNQKGVLLTSLAEIAAKLGVTRGAMYHYV